MSPAVDEIVEEKDANMDVSSSSSVARSAGSEDAGGWCVILLAGKEC